jgi:hypothetical protein
MDGPLAALKATLTVEMTAALMVDRTVALTAWMTVD